MSEHNKKIQMTLDLDTWKELLTPGLCYQLLSFLIMIIYIFFVDGGKDISAHWHGQNLPCRIVLTKYRYDTDFMLMTQLKTLYSLH